MSSIQQKLKQFLLILTPFVYCLTGVAIVVMGLTSIIVLTKFTSFDKAWVYYSCITAIYMTSLWWGLYFIYKGGLLFGHVGEKATNKTKGNKRDTALGR